MGTIPVVDMSTLLSDSIGDGHESVARHLAHSMRAQGCAAITGHGMSEESLRQVFGIMQKFFGLPSEEKAKAKHPLTLLPHRGYLATSIVRSQEFGAASSKSDPDKASFKHSIDCKESFDFGHEENRAQENIWPPDEVLPGFRKDMIALFNRLNTISFAILEGLMVGMDLSKPDREELRRIHSPLHHQMRLAHYLPLAAEDRQDRNITRLAAHTDFASYTLLFQESAAGLEFQDRDSGVYMPATPKEGVMHLNIGDIMERYSNGFYPAAKHRVAIPPVADVDATTPGRYSIPYFTHVALDQSIYPLQSRVEADGESRYEPIEAETMMFQLFRPHVGGSKA